MSGSLGESIVDVLVGVCLPHTMVALIVGVGTFCWPLQVLRWSQGPVWTRVPRV